MLYSYKLQMFYGLLDVWMFLVFSNISLDLRWNFDENFNIIDIFDGRDRGGIRA